MNGTGTTAGKATEQTEWQVVQALSAETQQRLGGNMTHRLPNFQGPRSSQIDELNVDAAFLNHCANLMVALGENSRVKRLSLESKLPSGARGCPTRVKIGEGVYLPSLRVVDEPGDVTGGLGNCLIEVLEAPRYGSGIEIFLGADWAYQSDLRIIISGDTVTVNCAAVIPVLKFFNRETGKLVIRIGFEPTGFEQRNPRG